ncbi:hypothetical protein [Chryseobacterium sp. HSC-36S06]|uniref:hypothetical protein n=1 Tax=Chryseobacterium sp. HSC-36S06 TaxID=2910970 RepID=UPI00209F5AAF|nr:hypothetical protein [Chryseobacterium sp. HSC-36S06]MCP2039260.1 magnesium-transporting ATPase (P-type) [Chryseobacterium sp. HSC-36S06]
MKPTATRNILISLLLFLGVSAIGGGGALIISPSGKLLGGLPLSILAQSPFPDFLIPGIILFTILGFFPCYISYALIKKPTNNIAEYFNLFKDMYWAWSYSIYIGFALIIWIQVETIFINGTSWLQTFYILYSIPIIFVALLPKVRTLYKK